MSLLWQLIEPYLMGLLMYRSKQYYLMAKYARAAIDAFHEIKSFQFPPEFGIQIADGS